MVHSIGTTPILGQYVEEAFVDGNPPEVKLQGPLTDEMRDATGLYWKHQYNIGYPVSAENVPTIWRWSSTVSVPDYYEPHGFPCVSSVIKELVEEIEPGVHQFFPLRVEGREGRPLTNRFLWVLCNRIASVDRNKTNLTLYKGHIWRSEYKVGNQRVKIDNSVLFFSNEISSGFHFWRDKEISRSPIFLSDDAARRLSEVRLGGLIIRPERSA